MSIRRKKRGKAADEDAFSRILESAPAENEKQNNKKGAPKKKSGKKPQMKKKPTTVSEESNEQLLERLEKEIGAIPEVLRDGTLIRQGDYVHVLPKDAPNLDGVKTTKPGLCLMRVGRSHVQPMPALAKAMSANERKDNLGQAKRKIEVTEEQARRILQGERLNPEGQEKGWTLLTYKNLPLDFQKLK